MGGVAIEFTVSCPRRRCDPSRGSRTNFVIGFCPWRCRSVPANDCPSGPSSPCDPSSRIDSSIGGRRQESLIVIASSVVSLSGTWNANVSPQTLNACPAIGMPYGLRRGWPTCPHDRPSPCGATQSARDVSRHSWTCRVHRRGNESVCPLIGCGCGLIRCETFVGCSSTWNDCANATWTSSVSTTSSAILTSVESSRSAPSRSSCR